MRFNRLQRQVVNRRTFPRDAIVIHRVRTVSGDVHFEDGVITLAADRLDGDPGQSQIFRKLMIVDVEVNEIAYPLWRKFHC